MVKYRDTLTDVENILELIRHNEKTAQEVSSELNIPIATSYRLLKTMFNVKWVRYDNPKRNKHGASSKTYLAMIRLERFRDNGG